MITSNPALLAQETYFFVELELRYSLVNLIHTIVFEKQET